MASILQYEVHSNVQNPSDMLDLFVTFAVSCGWTLYEQIKGKKWGFKTGQNYGFWDDNTGENYAELRTVDYGGNTIYVRIQVEGDNTIATDGKLLNHSILNYDGAAINKYLVSSATHPYLQAAKTNGTLAEAALTTSSLGIKATAMPHVFFFGNNKTLYIVMQFDSTYIFPIGFGILELFNQTEGLGWWMSRGDTATTYFSKNWAASSYTYNGFRYCVARPGATNINVMDGSTYSNGLLRKDWTTYSTVVESLLVACPGTALSYNAGSKIRPAFHSIYYLNESSVYKPFARDWHVNVNTYNLELGEQLKLGNETFITFPQLKKNIHYNGFAFRVA